MTDMVEGTVVEEEVIIRISSKIVDGTMRIDFDMLRPGKGPDDAPGIPYFLGAACVEAFDNGTLDRIMHEHYGVEVVRKDGDG
jgi:hypothetical protein